MHGSLLSVSSRGAVVYTFKLRKHAQFRLIQLRTDKYWCLDQFWAICALNASDSNWIPVKLNFYLSRIWPPGGPSQPIRFMSRPLENPPLTDTGASCAFFPKTRSSFGFMAQTRRWLTLRSVPPVPWTKSVLSGSRPHGASGVSFTTAYHPSLRVNIYYRGLCPVWVNPRVIN